MARSHSPHPGQHRRSGDSTASSGCRSQRGAHHLRRASAHPPAGGACGSRSGRRSIRMGWLHVSECGSCGAREALRLRPRCSVLLRPSSGCVWTGNSRRPHRVRSATGSGSRGRFEHRRPSRRLAAIRLAPRSDQQGVCTAGRHRHGHPGRWSHRIGMGSRRHHGISNRAGGAAACSRARGHQDRWLRRGDVHLEQHSAQPGRDRRQAASVDRCCVHRPTHREDGRGARLACGRSR